MQSASPCITTPTSDTALTDAEPNADQPVPDLAQEVLPVVHAHRATATRGAPPTRQSARLAAKAPITFVDSTAKAMQLTKLKNSLASCSKNLKAHVAKKGLLGENQKPISVGELRKLATAAGLCVSAVRALDTVPASSE